MTLNEYMKAKYESPLGTLTRKEAKILGLRYPLQAGWRQRLGNEELPLKTLESLQQAMRERACRKQGKYGAMAARAVRAIDVAVK